MSTFPAFSGLRSFEYAQVDVFAERPLEGNALAVFADGRGLSTAEMQAIARETNLSETTFILPRDEAMERERGVRVRLFTVAEEVPFAGHPTLGTASWLYWHHPVLRGAEEIVLELGVGPIPVRFNAPAGDERGLFGTMRQNPPLFGRVHDRAEVAQLLDLEVADLDASLPVQTVSTGMVFCVVPMRSVEAAGRMRGVTAEGQQFLDRHGAVGFYGVTRASGDGGADWLVRMLFYGGEDPATGSAAGCGIAYLVKYGAAASGREVVFTQGQRVRRPSRLHVRAELAGETISGVQVGGRTIAVAAGRLFIP